MEYWIQTMFTPSKFERFNLDTEIDDGQMFMKVKMGYINFERVNRDQYQCDENISMMDFTNCTFNELKNLDCSTMINQVI